MSAKVKLEIESNLEPLTTVFGEANDLVTQSSVQVKKFGKDAQSAYKNVTSEVDKFGKEVKVGTSQVKELGKQTETIPKAVNKLLELKKQIKSLTSDAITLKQSGDLVGAEKAAKQAGHLKDELKDVQDLVKSVSGNAKENLANAFGKGTQIAAQGFEGVLAVQNLVGVKNEEFEKQLLRLQSIQSISRIAAEFGDIGDRLKEVKLGLTPITNLYTNANNALKNFSLSGKLNLKSLSEGAKGLFTGLKDGIVGFVKSGIAGIKTLGATLAANPLGIILIVITAVIGAMVLLRDKVKPIGDLFKALGEAVDAVGNAIKKVGQAIGFVASDFEEGLQKQIDGVDKVVEAIGERYDFEIAKASAAGKETERIEKEKLIAQANAIGAQIANLYALSGIAEYLDAKDLEGNKKNIKEIGHLNDEQFKQLEELTDKREKLIQQVAISQIKIERKIADDKKEKDKKAQEEAKAHAEKLKALHKELTDALLDLNKKAEQADLSLLSGKEKILMQKKINEEQVALLRKNIEDKGKLVDKNFKFTIEQEGQFAKLQLAIEHETADALLALEIEKSNRLADQRKKELDNELAFLDMKEKMAIAKVGTAKNETKLPEADFEQMKQRVIAQIKIKGAKDQEEIKKKQIQAEANLQITALENDIKVLRGKGDTESQLKADQAQKSIDAIKKRAQLEMQLLSATTEEEIKNLQDQINGIDKGLNKKKEFSLGKMLGLDDASMSKMTDAINTTIDSLKELSDAYFAFQQEALDKELKANDTRLSTREDNINDLKDRLEEEKRLQEQGLANNVDRIRAELDAQNAAKDADIAKGKQIQAEKKKLAKQQLIIDTALQASQMVLAIAQLFAQGSSFWVGPVPVGLIVAGLASVAMIASFAISKKKAFDAINSDSPGFKKGGYTGDVAVDEEVGPVHGKEFVHDADKTKRYRNLFEGIHQDNKPLIEKGLAELLSGTGVVIKNPELPSNLSKMKERFNYNEHKLFINKNDNSGMEKRLDSIDGRVVELIKQNQNTVTVLPDGTRIEKFGNITRTVKGK